MVAHRADIRSLGPDDNVTAVAAFPDFDTALLEDRLLFDVLQKLAIALLMGFLDRANTAEFLCQLGEALFLGFFGHALVHVGPLEIFTLCRVQKVLFRGTQLIQFLEPELGMLFLVVCRLQEQGCDLLIARLLCDGSKIRILVSGLALAGKGFPEVLLGFGSCILVCKKSEPLC